MARVLHKVMLNLEVGNAELGRSMGVSRQAALNWRTGKSSMTVETLEAIAAFLDVPVSVLMMSTPGEAVDWLQEHKPEQFVCTNSHSA